MKPARTKNTLRNTQWGVIYRLTTLLGHFIVRTLIVKKLGLEYSGLSSLFTSILTVLNLANLGFSSSIVFTMYRAIVDEDVEAQNAMVNFYKRIYRYVGLAILAMGLLIMPFLSFLVEGDIPADINLYSLFIIYLVEASLDYLMFAYNNAIFTAYQRTDISLKISTLRYLAQFVLQALALLIFANYYVYIIILPLMVIPNNIANYIYARRVFPDIKPEGELDDSIKSDIYRRVATLFGHKVGSTILVSVDSIIISAYLGLSAIGVYANYYYILTAVNAMVEIVTNGARSSIGNKLIVDSREDNHDLFKVMTYGWLFLIGAAASFMLTLYQPFVGGIWYGADYLMEDGIMALMVLYFYSWMFRLMQLTYRDAAGIWTEDWLKPYLGVIINVLGSIYLIKATGSIAGVLIPTIFVFFFVYFPWEAVIVFKNLFEKSPRGYFRDVGFYMLVTLFSSTLAYMLCQRLSPGNSLSSFLIRIPITLISFSFIWWIFTSRRMEYKRLKEMVYSIVRRI